MSRTKSNPIFAWSFSVLWMTGAIYLWWKLSFDGAVAPQIIDQSIFSVQILKFDLVVILCAIIGGLTLIQNAIFSLMSLRKQIALILTALALVICAASSQFWFFSFGTMLFILANVMFFERASLRNLLNLAVVSMIGFGLEPHFTQAPQWTLFLFFSIFLIFGFRVFPNGVVQTHSQEFNSPLASWVKLEAPALSVALFIVRRTPQILDEQSSFILKSIFIALSFLTLVRSYSLVGTRMKEQAFLNNLLLICALSFNLPQSVEWAPLLIVGFTLVYLICGLGISGFNQMKWVALSFLVLMSSPLFVFSHALINLPHSEEFTKGLIPSIILLSLFGLNTGVALAASMESFIGPSVLKPLQGIILFLLMAFSLHWMWTGVWVNEKDISLLANEGSWAPLSIFLITAITSLMAHRAIQPLVLSFSVKLNFQDTVGSRSILWLSEKSDSGLCWVETVFLKNGLFHLTSLFVQWMARVWSEIELKWVRGSIHVTRAVSLRTIYWWQKKQTSDEQYYLIFGIGTVALLLLHFLINAQL